MIRFPLQPDELAVAAYVVRVVRALTEARGNVRAAATALGETERTLWRRMGELGLADWNAKVHPRARRQPNAAANTRHYTVSWIPLLTTSEPPAHWPTCTEEEAVTLAKWLVRTKKIKASDAVWGNLSLMPDGAKRMVADSTNGTVAVTVGGA